MHIDDDNFIDLARKQKEIKGYVVFKCCKVTYDMEQDTFVADKTKNPFVKFLWWLIDTFPIWKGDVILTNFEEEVDEDGRYSY